jgi:HEAT repeat protein
MDPDILVSHLDDLSRGDQAVLELIAMGERAVDALTRFLLGPPALHPQPRMLAAEALGTIGGPRATCALVAALQTGDLAGLSLPLRLSEEAVRNRVARELGRLGDRSTIEPLLDALARFRLVEAGHALARFAEPRAVPLLVDCLADAFVRSRIAEAILVFGPAALGPLVDGLRHRMLRDGDEPRWSVERRAACARLLGEIGDRTATVALWQALDDPETEVRRTAAIALTRLAPAAATSAVVEPLLDGLDSTETTIVDACAEALMAIPVAATRPLVDLLGREVSATAHAGAPSRKLRTLGRTLAAMGPEAAESLAALTEHPSPIVRGIAVAYVGAGGGALAQLVIHRALADPDRRVRRTAAALRRRAETRRALAAMDRRQSLERRHDDGGAGTQDDEAQRTGEAGASRRRGARGEGEEAQEEHR